MTNLKNFAATLSVFLAATKTFAQDPNGRFYRCDLQGGERGVCILGNKTDTFKETTCNGECAGTYTPSLCKSDFDCSLAGVCTDDGACECDPWTSGSDCSYLNFAPLDTNKIGYLNEVESSWGGNALYGSDQLWHLYVAEIACNPANADKNETRCGLGGWYEYSQVVEATSPNVDGPYTRTPSDKFLLSMMHHNPSVKKSPVDGSWNLYTITDGGGPIEVTSSIDEGKTWTKKDEYGIISEYENPGPFIKPDNSMWMFYRDVIPVELQLDPTCSDESIGVQQCTSPTSKCDQDNNPVFKHTGEDPFVFQDGRGNYHMLINSLPGACIPKIQQGGHAWSTDGVVWSEPRVGAYNTTIEFDGEMQMADGSVATSMTCERRERPQMIMNEEGDLLAMSSGVTGCPAFGVNKGDGDCFTLIQLI